MGRGQAGLLGWDVQGGRGVGFLHEPQEPRRATPGLTAGTHVDRGCGSSKETEGQGDGAKAKPRRWRESWTPENFLLPQSGFWFGVLSLKCLWIPDALDWRSWALASGPQESGAGAPRPHPQLSEGPSHTKTLNWATVKSIL